MGGRIILKNLYNFFLDVIFPINCLGCDQEGCWICDKCMKKIEIEANCRCPHCQQASARGEYCRDCQTISRMQGIIIASSYENELLQKTIRYFKYKYITDLKSPLAAVVTRKLKSFSPKLSDYLIIPIPLHRKKLKFRGFNQAELLGKTISENTNIAVNTDIIKRVKNTSAQAKLSPLKRRKNIKNAFSINKDLPPDYLLHKKILLLDDVCTTSSTLEECAKELYKLRPKEIWGLVLARGK